MKSERIKSRETIGDKLFDVIDKYGVYPIAIAVGIVGLPSNESFYSVAQDLYEVSSRILGVF
ncbi:MAG: hypothetical protein U9Q06_04465 [Nanoarchaeota archaeon]|nr:hypothetical protein [Nanoarchaeota archaeon]